MSTLTLLLQAISLFKEIFDALKKTPEEKHAELVKKIAKELQSFQSTDRPSS